MLSIIAVPLIFSFVAALILTYPVKKIVSLWGLIDDPKTHKHEKVIHKKPIPRGGGLAIYLSFVFSALLFLPLDKHLLGILLGATLLIITGILDDKYNLNPYFRLVIQFISAAIPIAAGIGISFMTNPFGGGIIDLSQPQITFNLLGDIRNIWILSDLFALFWIVLIMNFLNWGAKGVDGQLSGVVAIAALTIMFLSASYSADIAEWPVMILAAITAGAFLGFLPWHTYPQKIMPSFSGSNLGGYLLAILSILTTAKVGTLAMVLAVPLIDSGYTVIRRLASGKSPVWGDRGHFHHRLLDKAGWSILKIMFFYWGITAFFGFIALNINAQNKLYTILVAGLILAATILWLNKQK